MADQGLIDGRRLEVEANRTASAFHASYPGRTFNLTGLRLFGYYGNTRLAGSILQYNILAYHPGEPTPVVVTFSTRSLAITTKSWSGDSRLKGLERAVIQFTPGVGRTYFIETSFTLD